VLELRQKLSAALFAATESAGSTRVPGPAYLSPFMGKLRSRRLTMSH